ncbi:MAG: IS3 family transposase [Erysipelotrichaceae bacterium]|nr:IS3 family transposase [Erysipelotrichaceae bacterium]
MYISIIRGVEDCHGRIHEVLNTQRIITKLKGLTPVQFRNQSLVTA